MLDRLLSIFWGFCLKITLFDFLSDVEEEQPFDVNKITIKDAIDLLQKGVFDRYFDRKKILNYIARLADDFFIKYYSKEFCPRCHDSNVKEIKSYGGFKKSFWCKDCRKKFTHRGIIRTHFQDWVIHNVVLGIYDGEPVSKIRRHLEEEMKSREREFSVKTKIPDEKTIYELGSAVAEKIQEIIHFLILLQGGLRCDRIFVDDAFSRRKRKRMKGVQKSLDGAKAFAEKRRKRRGKRRYYYVIVILDPDKCFTIEAYPSKKRDEKAFSIAFMSAVQKLKGLPKSVGGDKLKSMETAAEKCLPKSRVRHNFEKLKPYEKKELNKIERKIRELRKTIWKQKKYGTLRVLRTYVAIAVIGTNFVEPKDVLGGKTPAQTAGIPYPIREIEPWEAFLEWVRVFQTLFPKILKAGLKKIPGTPLSPSR